MEVDSPVDGPAPLPLLSVALHTAVQAALNLSSPRPRSLSGLQVAEKLHDILCQKACDESKAACAARFWKHCPLPPSVVLEKFWAELSSSQDERQQDEKEDGEFSATEVLYLQLLALPCSPIFSLFSSHLVELAASKIHREYSGREASQLGTIWKYGMEALAAFVENEQGSKLVWTNTQALSAVSQALMSSGKASTFKALFKHYNKAFEDNKTLSTQVARATGLALLPLATPFLSASEKASSAAEDSLSELANALGAQHGLQQGLAGLLRICLVRASSLPSKDKTREKAIRRSLKILPLLASCERERFGLLLCKLGRHPSPSRRLAAVECAIMILRQPDVKAEPLHLADCCVHVIVQRCSDKLPSVRAAALSCSWKILANEGASHEKRKKTASFMESSLQGLFVVNDTPGSILSTLEKGTGDEEHPVSTIRGPLRDENFQSPVTPVNTEKSAAALHANVVSLFRRRCADKSAAVRRNALSALAAVLGVRDKVFARDVEILVAGCSDAHSLVRKAAVSAFTWVVQSVDNADPGVVAMLVDCFVSVGAIDPERGPQLAAVEGLVSVLRKYPTSFFDAIRSSTLTSSFLSSVVKEMASSKQATVGPENDITDIILRFAEADNSGALMVLAPLVSCGTPLDASVVRGLFSKLEQGEFNGTESRLVLSIIRHVVQAKSLSRRDQEQMRSRLLLSLSEMKVEPSNVEAALSCISAFHLADSDKVFDDSLAYAESLVKSAVEGDGQALEGPELKLQSALAVISSVAALKSALPAAETVTRIQALAFSNERIPGSKSLSSSSSAAAAALFTKLRAHALVALGKLSLLSERMAKDIVPVLVQLLNWEAPDTSPALRNNALVILCDIATHHTTAVEGAGFDAMTNALGDPNICISRQALLLLTNLLQRDYMKWKPFTFLRFFPLLGAREGDLRLLASTVLSHVLGKKTPLAPYQYFVEAMFAMNKALLLEPSSSQAEVDSSTPVDHVRPPAAQSLASSVFTSQRDRDAFALSSKHGRRQVYDMLLSAMKPEHCIAVASRICQEILQPAADALLSEETSLLADALDVLSMDSLVSAVQALQREEERDDEDEDTLTDATRAHAARRQLVKQMMRRVAVNHIAPAIFALDVRLRVECSPLQQRLLSVAGVLLTQFATNLEDLFPTERIFVSEIREHMRQANKRKRRRRTLETKKHVEFLIESHGLQADAETTTRVLSTPGMTTAAATAILSPSPTEAKGSGGGRRRLTPATTPRLTRAAVDSANKAGVHPSSAKAADGDERHERYRELESIKRRI